MGLLAVFDCEPEVRKHESNRMRESFGRQWSRKLLPVDVGAARGPMSSVDDFRLSRGRSDGASMGVATGTSRMGSASFCHVCSASVPVALDKQQQARCMRPTNLFSGSSSSSAPQRTEPGDSTEGALGAGGSRDGSWKVPILALPKPMGFFLCSPKPPPGLKRPFPKPPLGLSWSAAAPSDPPAAPLWLPGSLSLSGAGAAGLAEALKRSMSGGGRGDVRRPVQPQWYLRQGTTIGPSNSYSILCLLIAADGVSYEL